MAASVAYRAVLDIRRDTVVFLSTLLHAERRTRGTHTGTRAIGCFTHAILVLRWFLDGTRIAQLARDNTIATSTAYRYLHEGIAVLAAANQACTQHCSPRRSPDTPTSTSTAH